MSTWHSPASNAAGIAWALAGVGLFALIYVSGKLSGTEASALQIMWLRYVGGLLTMLGVIACKRLGPKALATSRPVLHAGRAAAGGFGGVAAVYVLGPVAIVGQYCNIQAFRRAAASVIGPVRYAWILYGTLFGVLFFNEPVSAMAVAGIGLILCGGGWLAVLRNRRG